MGDEWLAILIHLFTCRDGLLVMSLERANGHYLASCTELEEKVYLMF